jgi:HSP20 family protein
VASDGSPDPNQFTAFLLAPAVERGSMQALREALRDLPDAAFADLLEADDEYLLVVDVPGATADSTDVRVEDGRLRVEALRQNPAPEGFEPVEEGREPALVFELPLPPDVSETGADASVERGVLELRLPRTEESETTIHIDEQ